MIDMALRTGQIRQVKAKLEEIAKKYEEAYQREAEPYEKWLKAAEAEVLSLLIQMKVQNFKTSQGTPHQIHKVTYPLENMPEFRRHIIGSEAWDLADWKANKTAIDRFRLENGGQMVDGVLVGGNLPPGVRKNELITLGVTAPTKASIGVSKTKQSTAPEPTVEKL